jgi:hypothetical protein
MQFFILLSVLSVLSARYSDSKIESICKDLKTPYCKKVEIDKAKTEKEILEKQKKILNEL